MISRYLLSKDQVRYLTSQNATINNLSKNKRRIAVTIGKAFNTLSLVLDSKKLIQEFKDMMFNPTRISLLINSLTQHDPKYKNIQELNKQEIILQLIEPVISS